MKLPTFKIPNLRPMGFVTVAILFLAGAAFAATDGETESAYTNEDCIECHQTGSEESELLISVQEFEASAHAEEATCQDCHTGVVDDEHQEIEGSGATECGECHEQENEHGLDGSEKERPQCHDCHTRHNMLAKDDPASSVHATQLPATCSECHPVASGKEDFFSWFPAFRIASHNKADFGEAYEKDNCLGCHQGAGAHGEPEAINAQTCQKCHFAPELTGAMWGRIHPEADMQTQPTVFAAASIYQMFIVIGIVLLVGKRFRRRPPSAHETDTEA